MSWNGEQGAALDFAPDFLRMRARWERTERMRLREGFGEMRRRTRGVGLCLAAWTALLAPVAAQDGTELEDLESWIVIEEEAAPEPPLYVLELGFVGWTEVRSRFRADRRGVVGTRLDDLEQAQGLDSGGLAPWIELSIGAKVRGGADALWFPRDGELERQEEQVVFDGVEMARPGDLLKASYELLSLGGFIEWSALYGRNYRIAAIGGVRYFRLDIELESYRAPPGPPRLREEVRGELLSPFFGGLAELTPFPYLSVYTRAQFVIWSWEEVELKEARFLDFRLGFRLNLLPGVLGFSVEYRFLVVRAEPDVNRTDARRVEAALTTSGASFGLRFSF